MSADWFVTRAESEEGRLFSLATNKHCVTIGSNWHVRIADLLHHATRTDAQRRGREADNRLVSCVGFDDGHWKWQTI